VTWQCPLTQQPEPGEPLDAPLVAHSADNQQTGPDLLWQQGSLQQERLPGQAADIIC